MCVATCRAAFAGDLKLSYKFNKESEFAKTYDAHSDGDILILLNLVQDAELKNEGTAREVINRVQRLRKKAGLSPLDAITVHMQVLKDAKDAELATVFATRKEYITEGLKAPVDVGEIADGLSNLIIAEEFELFGAKFKVALTSK